MGKNFYGYFDPSDPHGYRALCEFLRALASQLRTQNFNALASAAETAAKHFGLSPPSEFLGEAKIALQEILQSGDKLAPELVGRIKEAIKKIDDGFVSVGDEVK